MQLETYIIHDDGLSMRSEAPVSQKHPSASQPVPRRRRIRLYVVAVVTAIARAHQGKRACVQIKRGELRVISPLSGGFESHHRSLFDERNE